MASSDYGIPPVQPTAYGGIDREEANRRRLARRERRRADPEWQAEQERRREEAVSKMRRKHNPNNIRTNPVGLRSGEDFRKNPRPQDWTPCVFGRCVDCGVNLPEHLIRHTNPIRCGDCYCIHETGEQCKYSTENWSPPRA